MKPTVKIISLILLLAIGSIGFIFFKENEMRNQEIVIHGNVDIRQIDLGFRVAGRLLEMKFEEGDKVKAGTLLARLEPKPYELELANQEAQLQATQANYDKYQAGNRPQEVQAAQAAFREKEVAHANALISLNRQRELVSKKYASQQTYDDAVANEKELRAQLNSAIANLNLLESGFRNEDIRQAQAQYLTAIAGVDIAKNNLNDTHLFAPSDGIIFTRIQEPGSIIAVGEPVYTLSISNPIWVRGYISEINLGNVTQGMRALVYIDTFPKEPFEGQVGFISPQAEFTPKNIETKAIRTDLVYRIRVAVSDPNNRLKQGMPVVIHLQMQKK